MILCLTHSRDFYTIDIVQQHLEQAGFPSLRFNTDEFATQGRFDYSLRNGTTTSQLVINDQTIDISTISGVWYRKLWSLQVPPDLDEAYHDTFRKEYNTLQQIFFNQLSHLPWMNKMAADHAAGNDKFRQLSVAQSLGLTIPDSIFTNDPVLATDFFERCHGNMIAKLHGALSRSMEGNTAFFPTTRITKEDLSLLDGLPYCPMIFQAYIPKQYELRIVYADGEFFTGRIDHEQAEVTDWRTIRDRPSLWQHYELPVPIQEKISRLMQKLDLVFGALDMIRSRNGDYVFLEVNPQGEWGMLQKDLGYPIGETIAQKLITRIKNGYTKNTDHYAHKRQ